MFEDAALSDVMTAEESASALFERHGAMVYRRCRGLLGQHDAAADAVQEVFVRVLGQRSPFRGESAVATWLYSIATLHCLQRLRNQRRHRLKLEHLALAPAPAERADPDDRLTVAALLDACEPEVQQIVVLRIVDGMSGDEVADVLGLSRKTVTRKLQRFLTEARAQLARALPASDEASP